MPLRKVQLTGTSTYIVSLPKEWATRNGLKPGSEVEVREEKDGSVSVFLPTGKKEDETAVVWLEDLDSPESLQRLLISKYIRGYDVIRLVAKGKIPTLFRQATSTLASTLIGVEIVEEKENEITIQDFFSREGVSMDKMIRRAYTIACSMHEDAVRSLLEGDVAMAQRVCRSDDEVDRIRFLITRQLNLALGNSALLRSFGISATDCLDVYMVVASIEGIADASAKIAAHVQQKKPDISKELVQLVREMSSETYGLHGRAMEAFNRNDFGMANDVMTVQQSLSKKLWEKENAAIARWKVPVWFTAYVDSMQMMCNYAVEIAKVVMNKDTRRTGRS